MNADVLQRIYEYAGYDERMVLRSVFSDVEFRTPRLRESTLVVRVGDVSVERGVYTYDFGPYTVKKSTCYFCNFLRVDVQYGVELLGSICVLPWCICNGLCDRARIHDMEEADKRELQERIRKNKEAWQNRKRRKRHAQGSGSLSHS
jgi:hypothetical protein